MNESIHFTVPSYEEVAPDAQATFDMLKKITGKVPNLYATIGYSANGLNSYMAYVQAQAKGSFHLKEREAVYLIVSQLNSCEYCLASHTQSAIKSGWTEPETLQLRAGRYADKKWLAIYSFIESVILYKGKVDDDIMQAFYDAGYNHKAVIDLMVLINIMSLTNYTYRLTKIPIDFPAAKAID
jgi:AhpD family alkylhydroperoxidase